MSTNKGMVVSGVIIALLFAWVGRGWLGSVDQIDGLLAQADSARAQIERFRVQQQADSTALEVAIATHVGELAAIAEEREQARQSAARASRSAREASGRLRQALDSLAVAGDVGGATAALDSLEAAHGAEVAALEEQLAAADSATASVQSLLVMTENALASERELRMGAERQIEILEGAVSTLRSDRKRERLLSGGAAILLVGVALLR